MGSELKPVLHGWRAVPGLGTPTSLGDLLGDRVGGAKDAECWVHTYPCPAAAFPAAPSEQLFSEGRHMYQHAEWFLL